MQKKLKKVFDKLFRIIQNTHPCASRSAETDWTVESDSKKYFSKALDKKKNLLKMLNPVVAKRRQQNVL